MEGAKQRFLSASERGGVIQGFTPIHSHVQLYLVQIILIVVMCFVLGQLVKKWHQPRVIAEVMAGVLLGPSALGAIPGFTNTLFPDESLEALTLTAHLGLILFLFIVGLELDPALLRSNAKKAGILSLTGQGVTWVLSLGVSQAMITWMDDVESSTSFVLFIGVSLSVTAFPVLSRILGENSLLNTTVGSLVISAASVDEACVWCLLALVVSTANAGSPLDAFYVFLLLAFFVVIMLTVGRWGLLRLVQRISGDDTGAPSRGVVILCLLLTLVCAWVTDFIGIDAIFGAFVAGIIVPREHSLHVRIVELVQDVVSVLLLPLYFAVSGLKTDLTLLDNATSWGICVLTILAACLGKIGGGAAVARTFGMTTRESLAVGVLMNTRGLVELIILNIGLDAGVLTEEVMAIMVVMALVTTFLTAPLSALVYPLKYHSAPGHKRLRRASEVSAAEKGDLARPLSSIPDLGAFAQQRLKLLVVLTNPAALDSVARVARLFSGNQPSKKAGIGPIRRKSEGPDKGDQLVVHALRLVENTDRFSSDMRALEKGAGAGDSLNKDNLAGILQGFLGLLMIRVMGHVSVGTSTDFCRDVAALSDEHGISTLVFPWEARSAQPSTQLMRVDRFMATTQCQVAIALNCHTAALAAATSAGVSLLVPFFGGDDDIAALLLALAIVERDTTAELVILSFLEPEKPSTGGGGTISEVDGSESRRESGSLLSRFVPSSESRKQSIREGSRSPPSEYKDLESAGSANIAATAPAATAAGARPPAVSLSGPGQDNDGAAAAVAVPLRRSASTWSSRDLVKRAEGLPRVRVTPAWSLNAALGTMSSSSPTTKDASTTTASSIVQEVAAARSSGLVICGCAGSGQLPVSDRPEAAPAEGVNGVRAIGGAPLAGANSVHGKWPSLGPLSRSRHNPTLSTRSWHGKARPLGGRSLHSSRHGAGGAKVSGVRGNGRGGLASAVDNVIHSALVDIVGDVAGGLARAEREPAVLAVRASIPATKTATV